MTPPRKGERKKRRPLTNVIKLRDLAQKILFQKFEITAKLSVRRNFFDEDF